MRSLLLPFEIITLLICIVLGFKWTQDPQGNYESWLFLAGLVFISTDLARRYWESFFSSDAAIPNLIPWFKNWLNRPVIVQHRQSNWWHMGKTGDQKPAMQIVSYWYVTNSTDSPISILSTYIVKPKTRGQVITKDLYSEYHGSYPVPPHSTTDLVADFWITPPMQKVGKDLKLDIVFVDQHGQKRKIKNVEFHSNQKKKKPLKDLQEEAIYRLENDIEKRVASVLKDEISRYKKNGRKSGELGSIFAVYRDQSIRSIYQDGWTSGKSGQRQEIVIDPENARVVTENGDSLVNYYQELDNDADKELFINSLLTRMNREKEYYCVSYLCLYVLFRTKNLKAGLEAAKTGLELKPTFIDRLLRRKPVEEPREVHQRYGFSDALGLINGLLRYDHDLFSDKELDFIEEFIHNLNEHSFRIEEKLNSIRSYRLSQQTTRS